MARGTDAFYILRNVTKIFVVVTLYVKILYMLLLLLNPVYQKSLFLVTNIFSIAAKQCKNVQIFSQEHFTC